MCGLRLTVLLTTLILTISTIGTRAETTCVTNALGDRTCTTVTSGTTTGNILENSTFGTGSSTTTTGWSTTGSDGIHTHGNFGFSYPAGSDSTGGVLAFEGHIEDNVYQDQSLVGDGHLTKSQINEGFTATQSADVWFWNMIENTLTLKQTITAADGTVTTQTRTINDHDPNRPFNGGNFENYTNVYTHSANTQNDFTIRTELYNQGDGTNNDNYHRGPDVDNVQLSITTAGTTTVVVTPCAILGTCTTAGDDIQDAIDLETDEGRPIFDVIEEDIVEAIEDFDTIEINPIVFLPEVELEIVVEDDFGFTEIPFEEFIVDSFETFLETNDLTMDFQQELVIEDISEQEFFEELSDQMVEELGADMMTLVAPPDMMMDMEMPSDMAPIMTEQEMNDFVEANPDMIEFADENTIVLRPPSEMENNMPEMEEIKEEPMENITVAEAPEDVQGKPNMEETPNEEIITESPKEEVETSTETNTPKEEEPNATTTNENTTETSTTEETLESNEETTDTRQESEAVSSESEMDENTETEGQEKTESDGEIVQNKSDVSVKERGSIKTKADVDIGKKVARIIKKLEAKLKRVDDKIKATSYVLSVTLQNLQPNMSSYINKSIPDGKNLVGVPNDDFFDNINRIAQQQIYKDASLNAYTSNDPIAVHNRLLVEIDSKKRDLKAEIAALRSLLK